MTDEEVEKMLKDELNLEVTEFNHDDDTFTVSGKREDHIKLCKVILKLIEDKKGETNNGQTQV